MILLSKFERSNFFLNFIFLSGNLSKSKSFHRNVNFSPLKARRLAVRLTGAHLLGTLATARVMHGLIMNALSIELAHRFLIENSTYISSEK